MYFNCFAVYIRIYLGFLSTTKLANGKNANMRFKSKNDAVIIHRHINNHVVGEGGRKGEGERDAGGGREMRAEGETEREIWGKGREGREGKKERKRVRLI